MPVTTLACMRGSRGLDQQMKENKVSADKLAAQTGAAAALGHDGFEDRQG